MKLKSRVRRSACAARRCDYYLLQPDDPRPGAVPLVSIHGVSRNATEHMTLLSAVAERAGAVLIVPVFGARHRGYQRLRAQKSGVQADLDLLAILAEVESRVGVSMGQVNLFGFSGGAQFSHRFALVYPERVSSLLVVAAGWYTFPNPDREFPFGLKPSATHADLRPDLAAFARIPTMVVVGARDTRRDPNLRVDAGIDDEQGPNRVVRAVRWSAALGRAGACVKRSILPGVDHSFAEAMSNGNLASLTASFFYGAAASPSGF